MVLMDHFKSVSAQSPHNGVSPSRLSQIFGAPLFCTSNPKRQVTAEVAANIDAAGGLPGRPRGVGAPAVDFLDATLAGDMLALLLDLWPGRASELVE